MPVIQDPDYQQRVAKSIASIQLVRKQAMAPVEDYLQLGEYLHDLELSVPSTKLRHTQMVTEHPELDQLYPSLRSDSKRLWEAVNGFRDHDLLEVLHVTDIRDYHQTHPSVILRDYRGAKELRESQSE